MGPFTPTPFERAIREWSIALNRSSIPPGAGDARVVTGSASVFGQAPIELGDARRKAVFLLLLFVTALSAADRQILGLLLEPIRREFGLSDTQLGILSGPAFTVLYATLALPLAILSDRVSRRAVLAASIAAFSAMTALCGLAPTYLLLLAGRVGTAVGEAGAVPASQAIIAEIYPKGRLTVAMSNLYLSGSVGGIAAFLIGGFLTGLIGWRMTFIVIGIPGVILALACFVILPRRSATSDTSEGKNASLRTTFGFLWSQATFRNVTIANALSNAASAGAALWAAPFIARSFGLPPFQIGIILAVVLGLSGSLGLLVIGYIAQRAGHKDPRWILRTVAITLLAATPIGMVAFFSTSGWIALIFACALAALTVPIQGPAAAVAQMLVTNSMRSVAVAVKHLFVTAVGASLGPLVVGLLSDHLRPSFGEGSIRYALMATSVMWAIAALVFLRASRTLPADLERAQAAEQSQI